MKVNISEIDIESLHETVRPIIKDVKEKGDAAIIEYNAKFDKALMTASQLKATEEEFAKARETLAASY